MVDNAYQPAQKSRRKGSGTEYQKAKCATACPQMIWLFGFYTDISFGA